MEFLILGMVLGLSAGLAPGPLLTLVISETLRHNRGAGIKVALSPVITDLPIILLTLFVLANLANFHGLLGFISILGGLFLLYMGYESIITQGVEPDLNKVGPHALTKGVIANFMNPHPYLFWFSIGGPIMTKAMDASGGALLAFLGSFYLLLVGTKVLLAIIVGKAKGFLRGPAYIYLMRLLGLVLMGLAFILFTDAIMFLEADPLAGGAD